MSKSQMIEKMKQRKDNMSILQAEIEHMKKLLTEMHKAIQFAYNAMEVNGMLKFEKEEKAFKIQRVAHVVMKQPKVDESVRENEITK